jgi:hypothetical protein
MWTVTSRRHKRFIGLSMRARNLHRNRTVWWVPWLASSLFACGRNSSTQRVTSYDVEMSSIVDGAVGSPPHPDRAVHCAAPNSARLQKTSFRVEPAADGTVIIRNDSWGCAFRASKAGAAIVAQNEECVLDDDAPLKSYGALRRDVVRFRLEPERATWAVVTKTLLELNTGRELGCAIGEGRILAARVADQGV